MAIDIFEDILDKNDSLVKAHLGMKLFESYDIGKIWPFHTGPNHFYHLPKISFWKKCSLIYECRKKNRRKKVLKSHIGPSSYRLTSTSLLAHKFGFNGACHLSSQKDNRQFQKKFLP